MNRWWRSKTLSYKFSKTSGKFCRACTHLWCVFLTHGKALKMLIATAMLVVTPVINIASCVFLWLMKIKVTRKISHANPEVAQPLWIPPRCYRGWDEWWVGGGSEGLVEWRLTCKTDVQPSRNQRGAHFAKRVFTTRYKKRPNNSFRTKMAASKFPRTRAPV